MSIYHWILLSCSAIFLFAAIRILFIGLQKEKAEDFSIAKGKKSSGIIYSYTAAMSPVKKESAYLHLPTYAAGLVFHLGTFLSFAWLIIFFFEIQTNNFLIYTSAHLLLISGICGIGILIKRIFKNELRQMSNPDDYFSNILVTTFQLITALSILLKIPICVLFIYSAILFLYMPLGKLRHSVYFFIVRYHLGRFFGKRGVWPSK